MTSTARHIQDAVLDAVLEASGDAPYDPLEPNDYEEIVQACAQRESSLERARRAEADLRASEQRREALESKSRSAVLASLATASQSTSASATASVPMGRGRGRALVLPAWMKNAANNNNKNNNDTHEDISKKEQAIAGKTRDSNSKFPQASDRFQDAADAPKGIRASENEIRTLLTLRKVIGAQRRDAEAVCDGAISFEANYDGQDLTFVAIFPSRRTATTAAQQLQMILPGSLVALAPVQVD
ncbi:Hypothetical Protein FCC1311_051792 [Hondaea fermentalgiana]|uniref:Uncharacterized protein n=1 Tax=Hondaea fermentalgiana TaxID=2315210 RepID=A0A2R5GGS4_9STRA|nr:Hypothetical Protein FCC1311_051792 [Hondaea fermentalgiana]|eukprot:GBG28958.1 Hypothetical Protein FCC1311_051792 [Hondaea fermentalgiana]